MPRWKNALQTAEEVSEIKRRAVLREASRIFSRRGYHNASLEDVAKALNVSKATLYNYVRDKQDILFECHTMALNLGDRALADAPTDLAAPALLEHFLSNYMILLFDEFGVCGVLTETDALRPEDRKSIVARRDAFETRIVALVEGGITQGVFRQLDAKLAAQNMMGAVNAISRWYTPEGRLTNVEIARETVGLFLGGLLKANPQEANS